VNLPSSMQAIGFTQSLAIEQQDSLFEFTTALPNPSDLELQVKVHAVAMNPVDAKVRVRAAANTTLEQARILGYDAVGTVTQLGNLVKGFQLGDRVYYAGDVTKAGSNAEYQTVDYRLVAQAPKSLSNAAAAVLPLTTLTAWEALFDRLRIRPEEKKTLLIIGGAGGVGSMTIQLAKQLTNLTVIATASRPETELWAKKMGADHVANHRDLVQSVKDLGFDTVDYIFNTADTLGHWDATAELIAPQGWIASIVEFDGGVDLSKLQGKSVGFVWELMFTRSLFHTDDMTKQQDILFQVANLIDAGRLQTTLTDTINGFGVEQIKEGHRRMESGKSIGKTAIDFG